jgi:hypothetical protein
MKRAIVISALVFVGFGSVALATPGQGDIHRGDVGRGGHPNDGTITFQAGRETVIYTATVAPGATSGWHRHPGAVVVLVKSGTLTTFGLDRPPCQGEDVLAGHAYFEDDAANARWPHFVRNRGQVPTEIVVTAFNVPAGGSSRTEADAPKECADPA